MVNGGSKDKRESDFDSDFDTVAKIKAFGGDYTADT
jgi:hypothetical protein